MSEAQRRLREATKEKGAKAAIARAIGCSKMTITSLVRGEYSPSMDIGNAIAEHLGFDSKLWSQKPKRNGKAA